MAIKGKIIDLFSGIGGFSLGFEKVGFKSILAIDNWSDAIQSYNLNRKHKVGTVKGIETFSNKDLKEIVKKEGKIDGIIGGPPCQGFSKNTPVSKRDADSENNLLIHEFLRITKEIKPKNIGVFSIKSPF